MTLTIGTRYKDRWGNTWQVTHHDPGFTYPFLAVNLKTGDVQSYTSEGYWSRTFKDDHDLRVA